MDKTFAIRALRCVFDSRRVLVFLTFLTPEANVVGEGVYGIGRVLRRRRCRRRRRRRRRRDTVSV